MNYVRLPLEGAKNTRDLGGYPTNENKITKFHTFIRSSRLTDITSNDNEFLKEYGVTDIIDLRGVTKIQATFVSDDNINEQYFDFHYIPLSTVEMEEYSKEYANSENFDYGIAYNYLLDNKQKIKSIFEVLANAKGATLFHCTAGKDRTGVIAALVLGLCGVSEEDIISNYEVTYTYIAGQSFLNTYESNVQKSDPKFMRTFIKKLKERYETFENFLLTCDISKEDLEKIKEKFLENI